MRNWLEKNIYESSTNAKTTKLEKSFDNSKEYLKIRY